LNSLLILSGMLSENKEGNLSADQVQYATTVYSAGRDLLALINEILDLSKVEAGKMPVEPKDVLLSDVRDYTEQTFKPIAASKGLTFMVEMDSQLPTNINTDSYRLQQILKNLLSNAFKFTEHGRVTLKVFVPDPEQIWPDEHGFDVNAMLAFSVQDTGIGIPPEKQQLIFEAFQQADSGTSRKYGGTGLGLTISREIARLLGGFIQVDSELGQGSTFTLYLPRNYGGPEMDQKKSTDEGVRELRLTENFDFGGRKILIVDDDPRNVFAISTFLKSRNMDVISAENGKVALQLLQENRDIDLILMDTMMPDMDGLDAIRHIRSLPEFTSLPIISLTAKAMKGDREKALDAGASDYITKPVDVEDLLALMGLWISKTAGLKIEGRHAAA
jgi:CheY-like chemotaxis protein